ncbi:hypothetical protein CAPI_08310 [Corynebacterium capitovis DSM 44611]|nr:hypothetical protein CAPI_08310 [Corynebacterium capitovis DSM 44611]
MTGTASLLGFLFARFSKCGPQQKKQNEHESPLRNRAPLSRKKCSKIPDPQP